MKTTKLKNRTPLHPNSIMELSDALRSFIFSLNIWNLIRLIDLDQP